MATMEQKCRSDATSNELATFWSMASAYTSNRMPSNGTNFGSLLQLAVSAGRNTWRETVAACPFMAWCSTKLHRSASSAARRKKCQKRGRHSALRRLTTDNYRLSPHSRHRYSNDDRLQAWGSNGWSTAEPCVAYSTAKSIRQHIIAHWIAS